MIVEGTLFTILGAGLGFGLAILWEWGQSVKRRRRAVTAALRLVDRDKGILESLEKDDGRFGPETLAWSDPDWAATLAELSGLTKSDNDLSMTRFYLNLRRALTHYPNSRDSERFSHQLKHLTMARIELERLQK